MATNEYLGRNRAYADGMRNIFTGEDPCRYQLQMKSGECWIPVGNSASETDFDTRSGFSAGTVLRVVDRTSGSVVRGWTVRD
jgi:hypothetical protein